MVDYKHSTQLKRWTFTQEQLLASNGDASSSSTVLQHALSADEERLLCAYYEHKAQEICSTALPNLPRKVAATAVTYVKRVYLTRSVFDQHPAAVMLTAIYLAGKVEEAYIGAEDFARQVAGVSADLLLKMEPLVLQALGYDLVTYTPYKAIDGFLHDLAACDEDSGLDPALLNRSAEGWHKAKARAYAAADVLMRSDAPLLFAPGKLALAALRAAFRKASVSLATYVARVAAKAGGELQQLEADLERLDALAMAASTVVTKEQAAAVDKKLKLCNNVGTAGGDAQARKDKKKAARKAKRRAEEAELLQGGGDDEPANKLQRMFDTTTTTSDTR